MAMENPAWTAGGAITIGHEIITGSALPGAAPVANLGQTDHPAANARIAARLIGPRPTGPWNQDDALLQALCLPSVKLEMVVLITTHGSDEDIVKVLGKWDTFLKTYPRGEGNPWAVVGSVPAFWYDTAALDFKRKEPTLKGPELIKAVRRLMHIKRPPAAKAATRPVKVRTPKLVGGTS